MAYGIQKHEEILEKNGINPVQFFERVSDHVRSDVKLRRATNSPFTSWIRQEKGKGYNLKLSLVENHVLGTMTLTIAKKQSSTYLDTITLTQRHSGLTVTYLQNYTESYFDSILVFYQQLR